MKDINKKRFSLFLGSALAFSSLAFPFTLKTETAAAYTLQNFGYTTFTHYFDTIEVSNGYSFDSSEFYPASYDTIAWIPYGNSERGNSLSFSLSPSTTASGEFSFSYFDVQEFTDYGLYGEQEYRFENALVLDDSSRVKILSLSLKNKAVPVSWLSEFFSDGVTYVSFSENRRGISFSLSFDMISFIPLTNELDRWFSSLDTAASSISNDRFYLRDFSTELFDGYTPFDWLSAYTFELNGDYCYFNSLEFSIYLPVDNSFTDVRFGCSDPPRVFYSKSDLPNYDSAALNLLLDGVHYVEDSASSVLYDVIQGFFNLEIFPGFRISTFFILGLAGLAIGLVMKLFLGG